MKKIEKIDQKILDILSQHIDDFVPGDYAIYKKETKEEIKAARIADLESRLNKIKEPTNEELLEEGRLSHPYYQVKDELDFLKNNE